MYGWPFPIRSGPDHQPLANQTLNNLSTLASVSISSYRDTFIGPSVQTKKRRLEGKLKHWGVADPGFRQMLAAKVQEYQFQELQDFIEANDHASNPVDDESKTSHLNMDNSWPLGFSQGSPADFFDWDFFSHF
ncbi:hypothetical protein FPRO04_10583 [Fusarium proliferatum]|nr:hypothetical protein FPRO04_10583 [Fusarium proliferatum]